MGTSGSSTVLFLVGQEVVYIQFFRYFSHLFQVFECLPGLGLIHHANGYAYVHQHIVVYLGMGHHFQAGLFYNAAKGYLGDLDQPIVFGFYRCYFSRDC